MSARRHAVASGDAPSAIGPYSRAVRHGTLLVCSGQVPLDPASSQIVSGSLAANVEIDAIVAAS
jgi:2-iminobutanoate/2-iminopropanoate deaminase